MSVVAEGPLAAVPSGVHVDPLSVDRAKEMMLSPASKAVYDTMREPSARWLDRGYVPGAMGICALVSAGTRPARLSSVGRAVVMVARMAHVAESHVRSFEVNILQESRVCSGIVVFV